ncbi:MAG: restriction endonuclease subunit S [Betaproteobacteria bacterium]|nr:restriction endonuclease subunit S [Betaproteobacteria bacterium]
MSTKNRATTNRLCDCVITPMFITTKSSPILWNSCPLRRQRARLPSFSLMAGDTIITKDSETADDIAIAAYVPNDLPGVICGYHLSMVRPRQNDISGAFIKRIFDSAYAKSCFAVLANGLTRVGLGQYAIDNIALPFPPVTEQTAIATFLDHETAKIDGLIAEQEKLIALLAEKRQATISHAVTKGLNPAAPMKDSGVPYLGVVPANWTIKKIKNVVSMRSGEGITSEDIENEGAFPVYGGNGLRGYTNRLTHTGEYLLVGRQGALCGNVHHITGEFWASEHAVVCTFITNDIPRWAFYMLGFMDLGQYSVSAAQPGLAVERIQQLSIAVPPEEEQRDIATFIDAEVARLEALTVEATHGIALLKERRSALISAAVTGKIDVRHVAEQKAA